MLILFIVIPIVLTLWNIISSIQCFMKHKDRAYHKAIELISMFIGSWFLYMYLDLMEIKFANWDVQLYNNQLHSIISPDSFVTIIVISLVGLLGYLVIRFIPIDKHSPIVSAVGIAGVYLGIGICILWCIQTKNDLFLFLFPANCILIFIKTIYILIYQKNMQLQNEIVYTRFKKLSALLNKASNLPWVALVLTLPLLGIIVLILTLFGQEPNSIIKAWTETADWTFSQKIAPQNASYDEHYLCTIAAGGHENVVKPIRPGIRHGHEVMVNRQLCIANAFEQILEEKMPLFHKLVRSFYDKTGYPISRHINSRYTADLIYFLMKPLEWIFLIVIYAVDVNPENRIAVQYPHSAVPKI